MQAIKLLKKVLSIANKDEVVIELGTKTDLYEMRCLLILFPFWAYFVPSVVLASIWHGQVFFIFPLGIFILFLCCYLRVLNNSFVFQKDSLVLPGVTSPVLSYKDVQSIAFVPGEEPVLELEVTDKSEAVKKHTINVHGLTIEGARTLWSNLAHRCKNARIEFEVRERLSCWNPEVATKDIYLQPKDKRELSIVLDLKHLNNEITMLDYTNQFNFALSRSWPLFWIFLSVVTLIKSLLGVMGISLGGKSFDGDGFDVIFEWINNMLAPLAVFQSIFYASNLWLTIPGTIGFVLLSTYVVRTLLKKMSRIDRIVIDYLGVTSQMVLPSGVSTAAFVSWKAVGSIAVKSENGSAYLVVSPLQNGKGKVAIPLRALAKSSDREKLQEAFKFWLKDPVDQTVLAAIRPRQESSYTELWLSSLSQVPGLEALTPLTVETTLKTRPYKVKSMLAAGGQGVTYLVENEEDKDNPLKVLKEVILPLAASSRSGERAMIAFERECKLLERIDHPRIARLEEHFIEDTRAYMVLEYVRGASIDKLVRTNGPLPEEQVVELALQMCDILEHLHSATPPVVHRDFTPQNLLVQDDGTLKLIDFGVALEQTDHARLEKSVMVGKQSYMPLEQIRGMATSRSDLYAMAGTLCYMLTGKEPEALTEVSVQELDSSIDSNLDKIIKRCTAQLENERYESARDLKVALEKIGAVK
ncbi:MAG: Serine/threonine protein kinase [Cyanobacteriota bacterium erpe_2018_sw_39hr_WHONDRS-SW48-000098_B_bin.30]|jgi:predicted Ser/Thr protein kinase|nr:Serine/threonine protein kinase [Cyanobacteriota bacterium erpe_2018_sw_39hr_WHONDRS-SW48-000098_B_bin.30]